MILNKKFYQKSTLETAQNLLGCFLVRKIGNKIIKGIITETEAYIGEDDLACHASKGRTPRTETMYGESGHAYVYMIYGMYHCLNIVTEKKGFPTAILIRSIKIDGLDYKKTDGPGKLCKFLKIDRKLNNWNITKKERLWIEKPAQNFSKKNIVAGRRIGIDYAKHCKEYPWRFRVKEK
ncbi:MAG: DNA-3-methyladenine glycosylase [Parcubacteria group bacterium]|jgi:DNA-3-methyladenine glycosylase